MPRSWDETTTHEKLSQLRSEVEVTNGVARRFEEIRGDLKTIESLLEGQT